MKKKTYTINLAELPTDQGILVIDDENTHEVITFEGVESPIIDYKTKKVIKPGKLLNVKRYIP